MSRRVVMITGANRGLGKAIAEELAVKGWDLSLGMRRPVPTGEALVHPFEATEPANAAAWVDATVERHVRYSDTTLIQNGKSCCHIINSPEAGRGGD
jgi:NAD(P)-dependent dehydrogenase (short-subunit alcohol dehydrogenase family)